MLKYKGMYWTLVSKICKKYLAGLYGKKEAVELNKKANVVYRGMLNETEDIGSDNPMATNIYMVYCFFAIYKATEGKMSADQLRKMTEFFMDARLIKKMMSSSDYNDPERPKKVRAMLQKRADWLDAHPQYKEYSWDFNFDDNLHRDGFAYHFTKCPIAYYCQHHELTDVLPIACDFDYLTAKLAKATLIRKETLGQGGSVCDYWYVGDQNKNPQ